MPDIILPVDGEKPYGTKLRTAISAVNDAVDAATEAIADGSAVTDSAVTALVANPDSDTRAELNTAIAQVAAWAKNPDTLISGAITRNSDQAVTSAAVVWPDGTPGTFTADTLSTAFPGAIDGYHITYGDPVQKTFTQPAITRNAAGAATTVPQIVVG